MHDRYEITINLRKAPPLHHTDPRNYPRWIVEAWDMQHDHGFPVGTAYVGRVSKYGWVLLEYVTVLTDYQRRGVATALVEWCKARWENIDGCEEDDACSDEGRALARKLARAERIEKDEIV